MIPQLITIILYSAFITACVMVIIVCGYKISNERMRKKHIQVAGRLLNRHEKIIKRKKREKNSEGKKS